MIKFAIYTAVGVVALLFIYRKINPAAAMHDAGLNTDKSSGGPGSQSFRTAVLLGQKQFSIPGLNSRVKTLS